MEHISLKNHNTKIDPKTKLQEFSLKKYKKLPIYKNFKKTGPNHNPIFKALVKIQTHKNFPVLVNQKKLQNKMLQIKLIKNLSIK